MPDVLVVADDAPRAIATAAGRGSADLIVMGTHGRRNWQKFMTGSVAEAVLHATDRPVLAVPQDSRAGLSVEGVRSGAERRAHRIKRFRSEPHGDVAREDPRVAGSDRRTVGEFRQLVSRGHNVAEHILEWADKIGAGYLVVGAQKKAVTHSRTTVGTTTERLLRTASVPVLSVMHIPVGASRRSLVA